MDQRLFKRLQRSKIATEEMRARRQPGQRHGYDGDFEAMFLHRAGKSLKQKPEKRIRTTQAREPTRNDSRIRKVEREFQLPAKIELEQDRRPSRGATKKELEEMAKRLKNESLERGPEPPKKRPRKK